MGCGGGKKEAGRAGGSSGVRVGSPRSSRAMQQDVIGQAPRHQAPVNTRPPASSKASAAGRRSQVAACVLCFFEAFVVAVTYSWFFSIAGHIAGFVTLLCSRRSVFGYLPALIFFTSMIFIHARILQLLWPWDEPFEDWTSRTTVMQVTLNWVGSACSAVGLVLSLLCMTRGKDDDPEPLPGAAGSPRLVVSQQNYPPQLQVPNRQPIVLIEQTPNGPKSTVLQPAGVAYIPQARPASTSYIPVNIQQQHLQEQQHVRNFETPKPYAVPPPPSTPETTAEAESASAEQAERAHMEALRMEAGGAQPEGGTTPPPPATAENVATLQTLQTPRNIVPAVPEIREDPIKWRIPVTPEIKKKGDDLRAAIHKSRDC